MLGKFNRFAPRLLNLAKQSKATFASIGGKDLSKKNTAGEVARRDRLQFSKERLTDFGDLPAGEIPEALKFDRQTETSQLNNGVKVASQYWPGQLATISVYIKAGSRQETLENSGVSHFLEHLNFQGTKNRSKTQLEKDVESLGGQITANTSRETTSYTLTVFKNNASKAVEILGDIINNSVYDKNAIEAQRETVFRDCIETQRDQMETTMEAVHYTSFRDHILGQPVLGNRDNIGNITQDHVAEFHKANYFGSNIVVVGTGDISHQQLADLAEKHFGSVQASAPSDVKAQGTERPYFTPSLMYMRDDEMANVNIGVFYEAPSWTHEDFYSFQLFQRILGEYEQHKNNNQHLNAPNRQYNTLHTLLGGLPDVTIHKASYIPYSDVGLFGSYFHGNEVHSYQMLYASQMIVSDYANYLNQVEIFRAKNKLYNELLTQETGADIAHSIANQLLYLNRVVPRSEIATRISNIEQPHLSRVARNWLYDTDISAVAWGPIHNLMTLGHYNRPIRRSTLGWYGDSVLYMD